jgi:hypothetical protein
MRRFFGSNKGKEVASGSSAPDASVNGEHSTSSSPPTYGPLNSGPTIPMTSTFSQSKLTIARWYIVFDGHIPDFLVTVCEALNLGWSVLKNSTEGSSGPADAAKNKFRERFVIVFPDDLDSMPSLMDEDAPPVYTDAAEEIERKAKQKRNIFDSVGNALDICVT